ncbi:hypothetical protein FVEN_g6572 [Fusarium venenatum]|uniref:Mid2 domain-containing protein n=1 Tax=Fusarium venenatum TaxID=56646 RepID=A0A2L2T8B4_9HYPO|nr:uncharacterized protein FVRRES_04873 [Fusarium venenatum]KAG8355778.1 hypothetical protein FVEN_g6572 [Fusarium venenatum]KAH6992006.1 hypothetical protein EDB82DRAFT_494913 [Fusarium venenatum]CEI60437.1 unnamed protein product [Fusarium venenatum]
MHLKHIFSITILLLPQVIAHEGICWGVNGKQWTDNMKCPGSSACCGPDATCMPNRLCQRKGQAKNQFIRGPCAVAPYDRKKCAIICIREETNDRFPRVEQCDDGSYCCDYDSGCCAGGRGVFLAEDGSIEDNSTSTTSEISSAFSTSTILSTFSTFSTEFSTTSSEPTTSSTEEADTETDSGGTSQGVTIGLGVGIPIAAIIAAVSTWLFLRRRSKKQNPPPSYPVTSKMYEQSDNKTWIPQELDGHDAMGEMNHGRSAKIPGTPQELQG